MSQLNVWNFDIFNLDILTGGKCLMLHVAGSACPCCWIFDLSLTAMQLSNNTVLFAGRSLTHVAIHLFKKYNLISAFKLDFIQLMQTFSK